LYTLSITGLFYEPPAVEILLDNMRNKCNDNVRHVYFRTTPIAVATDNTSMLWVIHFQSSEDISIVVRLLTLVVLFYWYLDVLNPW